MSGVALSSSATACCIHCCNIRKGSTFATVALVHSASALSY